MVRPALHFLRSQYPDAQIDLLTSSEAAKLMGSDSCVNRVLEFKDNWFSRNPDWRKSFSEGFSLAKQFSASGYDLAIDFRGDFRTILLLFLSRIRYRIGYGITGGGFLLHFCPPHPENLHQVEVNRKLLENFFHRGHADSNHAMPLKTAPKNADIIRALRGKRETGKTPVLVIHPAAGYPSKMWPEKSFQELINKIAAANNALMIILGTKLEKDGSSIRLPENAGFDLRGQTSLEDLPALFDLCDVYLGNDSGPAHLAAAQGIKVISLFSGTNDAAVWRPWGERVRIVSHKVSCSPCEARICPLGHHDCMRQISIDEVFKAVCDSLKDVSV